MTQIVQQYVGSKIILTDHFQTHADDGTDNLVPDCSYAPGDTGHVVGETFDADLNATVVLVRFDDERDLLSCVPGDGCEILPANERRRRQR